jgi:hypothetical protein
MAADAATGDSIRMNIGLPNPIDGVKKAAGAVKGAAEGAAEAVGGVASEAVNVVQDTASGLQGVVDGAWDTVTDYTDTALETIIDSGLTSKVPVRGDVASHAEDSRTFGTEAEAQAAQDRASAAMLDVNAWGGTLANKPPQKFELYDAAGHKVNRPAQQGDYVKITPVVAPGDTGAPVSNWVQVETASVSASRTEVVVRPSKDPTGQDPSPIAHTFDSRATNTFSVERTGNTVTSRVHGEHEYANDGAESGGTINAVRNRGAAEGLWGAPMRSVSVPGTDFKVTTSPQQVLWDTFTHNVVNR